MSATILTFGRPAIAQVQNGIDEPQEGDLISGVVVVRGSATDDDFLRYELAFSDGGDWLVFAEGDRPVVDDTLAIWDTAVGQPNVPAFPDGIYHLRLRVVRQDHNYSEYFVRNLTINNRMTPTPTTTETATEQAGTPIPTLPPDGTPIPEINFGSSTLQPTLAATPRTPVQQQEEGSGVSGVEQGTTGLLGALRAVDAQRFGRAFLLGAGLAFCGFMLLPLYLLLRGILRWTWRVFLR